MNSMKQWARTTTNFTALMATLLLASSCGFRVEKSGADGAQTGAGFSAVSSRVLQPNCVMCHNAGQAQGGVNLTSYDAVMASISSKTQTRIVVPGKPDDSRLYAVLISSGDDLMPKNGSKLSPALVSIVSDWIKGGALAPGVDIGITNPTDGTAANTNPPVDLNTTPAYLAAAQVFKNNCTGCHGATHPAVGIDLTTRASILAAVGENGKPIVIGGKPNESRLFQVLIKGDPKQMPLKGALLDGKLIDAVNEWIKSEAPVTITAPAPVVDPVTPVITPVTGADFGPAATIIKASCLKCHNGPHGAGGVDLSSRDAIFASIVDGKSILIPGKPAESRLYQVLILPATDVDFMPKKSAPLSADAIATFATWITAEGGATLTPPVVTPPVVVDPPVVTPPVIVTPPVVVDPPVVSPPVVITPPAPVVATVFFARDVKPILGASCVACHDDFGTFDGVMQHAKDNDGFLVVGASAKSNLIDMISSGEMPMGGDKLPDAQIKLIADWIDQGAVNEAPAGSSPVVVTPPVVITPAAATVTYTNNIAPILKANCIGCHKAANVAKFKVDLSSLQSITDYAKATKGFIDTTTPANSRLYTIVQTGAMPPPPHGKKLADADIQAFLDWIQQGLAN